MSIIYANLNNAAIHAALTATGKRHIITSSVEHSSVLNYCRALERPEASRELRESRESDAEVGTDRRAVREQRSLYHATPEGHESGGYKVTYLPVDRDGLLKLADLEASITEETAVVSLMWANNETGVLFPVKEIAELCRARGVLFHCDAVQAAGKIEIDVRKVPADYLSLTGHKPDSSDLN